MMLENKKIFVLGMSKSGYEVAKFLSGKGHQILVTDCKEQDEAHVVELKKLGVQYVITDHPEKLLDESYDVVVKNPGIVKDHICVKKARSFNIPVWNEVEIAAKFLPKDTKMIAVTGSNGKTTTVTLIYRFLEAMGCSVHLCGNIGIPLSRIVNEVKEKDIIVMEISDHQLCDMYEFHPNIAALTNLSEAHLDFHKDYETYKLVKKKLFLNMKCQDIAILNYDDKEVVQLTEDLECQKQYFSKFETKEVYLKEDAIWYHDKEIIHLEDIRVHGVHNYENIMCAISVVLQVGCSPSTIREVLKNFSGVAHRLEYVRKLNGRIFYNDSKATNIKSTQTALDSFQSPTILILGGYERGQSFDRLKSHMEHVKYVICYGQTKEKIEAFCHQIHKECVKVDSFADVVKVAYHLSEEGDIILLSPASASYGEFQSFEERGNAFKKIVESLN